MISNISIKNFKSVVDVSIPLGRFNLLIGANGCGKSNILEGIAIGAAASSDKLDYEYFANRGIRVVEPRFMLPAFDGIEENLIEVRVTDKEGHETVLDIRYDRNAKPARWVNDNEYDWSNMVPPEELEEELIELRQGIDSDNDDVLKIVPRGNKFMVIPTNIEINPFLIYSLEESKLRQADNSNRTYPLGRHGEGLFAYLKELAQRQDALDIFNEIKDNLKILDWFDDIQVPSGQLSSEFNLKLTDSYLAETINVFDQRSTNEGFLYLLFYFTLVISDETPRFFAIENIDTAFNPKLCREVIKRLVALAKKHGKQIIATTHNPAILDGLDLRDDEQKLMVVQRSIDGYTKVRTLRKDETVNSDLSLSQLWLRGFIGGLPNNF